MAVALSTYIPVQTAVDNSITTNARFTVSTTNTADIKP
jgi:hypothetical protein